MSKMLNFGKINLAGVNHKTLRTVQQRFKQEARMVSMKMKGEAIYSLGKYLLSISFVPGPVLSAGSTVVCKTNRNSACHTVKNRQVNNYFKNDIRNKKITSCCIRE